MFKLQCEVPSKSKIIEIIPLGDLHYGSPNCNIKKFKEVVKYIKDSPDTYVILMGDLWDSIIPSDPRFEPNEESCYANIEKLYLDVKKILAPIQDKILVVLVGNHEFKLKKQGYSDLSKRLARETGAKYGGFSCFIKVRAVPYCRHRRALVIFAHHGWSAGRKTGSVINAVENLTQYYEADIYLVGHSQ